MTVQCTRVTDNIQCPEAAAGAVAVAFFPFESVMGWRCRACGLRRKRDGLATRHGQLECQVCLTAGLVGQLEPMPLRRLVLGIPLCDQHQRDAKLEELMMPASLANLTRIIEHQTHHSVDPKGIKILPVAFDDPDYQRLEHLRRQVRATSHAPTTGDTGMRQITTHHDGHGLNESIKIAADGPGPGGASHRYELSINNSGNYEEFVGMLQFQNGPRLVEGSIPGVTEAALLAVLIDRLEGFQAGEYACSENAAQLSHLRAALELTHARAHRRAAAGTLGTMQPDVHDTTGAGAGHQNGQAPDQTAKH